MRTPQTPHLRRSTDRSSLRVGLLLVSLLLPAFRFAASHAVVPAPEEAIPANTAEGSQPFLALPPEHTILPLVFSLRSNTTGNFNTATGAGTLLLNTADQNTATGAGALLSNTIAVRNTANGAFTLFTNTTGIENMATVTKRSLTIQAAARTPPTVLLHSSTTQPATTTRPTVRLRSLATQPATTIRQMVLQRSTITNRKQ